MTLVVFGKRSSIVSDRPSMKMPKMDYCAEPNERSLEPLVLTAPIDHRT